MAGIKVPENEELQRDECSFHWDEKSQLYYHESSGFYHDPNAGWYYSSRDGLYYKYENESYVLLPSSQSNQSEAYQRKDSSPDNSIQDGHCILANDPGEADQSFVEDAVDMQTNNSSLTETLPPPSEWLEDTLIDLYLSGYSEISTASDVRMPAEVNDDAGENDKHELEEGEWVPNNDHEATGTSVSWEEEMWQAQYGQVTQSVEGPVLDIPVIDLWNWTMVSKTRKGGKGHLTRLVGRPVKCAAKLHPSMPSGGGLLKTSPICEVHLDLVRVTTGQVYKLRNPSVEYLASLTMYDSSNPTKDWGFPDLSIDRKIKILPNADGKIRPEIIDEVPILKEVSLSPEQLNKSHKLKSHAYRDRAAERRVLHGGFGVGPGQKKILAGVECEPSSPVPACLEEAAADSFSMSFGAGSYARRVLEGMGWKEGETLGINTNGLREPLQAVGNKGNAGLGWNQDRTKLL